MLCKSAIGFKKRYNRHMPECEAAILPTVKCDGTQCLWLVNETINGGSLSGIVSALKEEDPELLKKIIKDKAGPLFRTCANNQHIKAAAQKALAEIKSKK